MCQKMLFCEVILKQAIQFFKTLNVLKKTFFVVL